jgi:predicted RNase H-like HicB family nuclease
VCEPEALEQLPYGLLNVSCALGIVCGMSEQLDLTIVYEPGEEGWVIATIPEVAGVFSQGRTRDEARANVIDALRLMLSPEPGDADDRREREALHLTIAA